MREALPSAPVLLGMMAAVVVAFGIFVLITIKDEEPRPMMIPKRQENDRSHLRDVKQVIVIRRDLKMRRGKEISQGSHASMYFIYEYLNGRLDLSDAAKDWLIGGNFTKAVCTVQNEQELLDIVMKAEEEGVIAYAMMDNGKTEFGGLATYTAAAIGPDLRKNVDKVTAHLTLY